MLKNKKGFTLIELIIVVAIMAVLIALLAPNVMKYLDKSKVSKDLSTLDSVKTAVNAEVMDEKFYAISTGTEGDDVKGLTLSELETKFMEEDEAYNINDVLDMGEFAAEDVFECKAAKKAGAEIKVYLDGKGGVAVAAVGSDGKVVKCDDGTVLYVHTGLDRSLTDIADVVTPDPAPGEGE